MTLRVTLLAAVVAAVACIATARDGVDVSQATLVDAWKCLSSNGYKFGIIRCYQSSGHPDSNCPHTIYNAWDGGMEAVDIYMFPDPGAGNPAGQVQDMINYLAKYNVKAHGSKPGTYGTVWLDIEGTQYWSKSQSSNQAFFNGLVSELKKQGQTIGVYTSKSQWEPIMGSFTGGSSFPLWYAHYDDSQSFSDFSPFGGWSKPAMKQYAGDKSVCGAGVDKNWYPGAFTNATEKADA